MAPKESNCASDDEVSSRGGSAQPEDGDKEASSTQLRKAQNRIAQREFRLRKQQYIRDLEAKVQLLEGDKEERVEVMTLLVRNLLKENKDLRSMVRSMASFVGEGLGSCLPRLGLSSEQLDAIINRADTDTAYEAFVKLKASRELQDANPGIKVGEPRRKASAAHKRKRTETVEITTPTNAETPETADLSMVGRDKGKTPLREESKKPFSATEDPVNDEYTYLFPDLDSMLMASQSFDEPNIGRFETHPQIGNNRSPHAQQVIHPQPGPSNAAPPYPLPHFTGSDMSGFGLTVPPPIGGESFGNLAGPAGSSENPSQAPQNLPATSTSLVAVPPNSGAPSSSAAPPLHPNDAVSGKYSQEIQSSALKKIAATQTTFFDGPGMTGEELEERRKGHNSLLNAMEESESSDRKMEAMQLITYHLNNFRMNHEYHLPPSLRPTVVQRTVPHEHAIDGICFPSMRDRMILLRGRYDLVEVFHALLSEFTLHGDDVLDHRSYEVSENFVRDYHILVDDSIITVSNRWRALRGEPPIKWPLQTGESQMVQRS